MDELLDGAFEGKGFDYEWIPKTCSMVPLDPISWTQKENSKCQSTITMLVSTLFLPTKKDIAQI